MQCEVAVGRGDMSKLNLKSAAAAAKAYYAALQRFAQGRFDNRRRR
jgi:hypothetical protein